jgi:hypothetical protein
MNPASVESLLRRCLEYDLVLLGDRDESMNQTGVVRDPFTMDTSANLGVSRG